MEPVAERPQVSASTRARAWVLIALMAIGSVVLWLGIPFAWVYGVSRSVDTSQPSFGPYAVVLIGIPTSMVLMGRLLNRLDAIHAGLMQVEDDNQARLPWLKSMRDGRGSSRRGRVLDTVMVASVTVALALFGTWFLFFADGGGLPGA